MTVVYFPASKPQQEMLKNMGLDYKFNPENGIHTVSYNDKWNISGASLPVILSALLPTQEEYMCQTMKNVLNEVTKQEMLDILDGK